MSEKNYEKALREQIIKILEDLYPNKVINLPIQNLCPSCGADDYWVYADYAVGWCNKCRYDHGSNTLREKVLYREKVLKKVIDDIKNILQE